MSDFDITKAKKLTRADLEPNKKTPLLTLEGLKAMCNYFDEENPTTYEIFLKYRPDLGEEDVAYYRDIINTLNENLQLKREVIGEKQLRDYKDVLDEVSTEVKYENVGKCFIVKPADITLDMTA